MNQEQIAQLGKVAVLMGGRSGERPVSIMSGTGVLNALKAKGVDAHAFDKSLKNCRIEMALGPLRHLAQGLRWVPA